MMKTSDAMRLADATGLPDQRWKFIEQEVAKWGGEKPPCCAIGGAAIAAGQQIVPVDGLVPLKQLEAAGNPQTDDWERLTATSATCPIRGCYRRTAINAHSLVVHLYDYHDWSRTQIADWLDWLELGSPGGVFKPAEEADAIWLDADEDEGG